MKPQNVSECSEESNWKVKIALQKFVEFSTLEDFITKSVLYNNT